MRVRSATHDFRIPADKASFIRQMEQWADDFMTNARARQLIAESSSVDQTWERIRQLPRDEWISLTISVRYEGTGRNGRAEAVRVTVAEQSRFYNIESGIEAVVTTAQPQTPPYQFSGRRKPAVERTKAQDIETDETSGGETVEEDSGRQTGNVAGDLKRFLAEIPGRAASWLAELTRPADLVVLSPESIVPERDRSIAGYLTHDLQVAFGQMLIDTLPPGHSDIYRRGPDSIPYSAVPGRHHLDRFSARVAMRAERATAHFTWWAMKAADVLAAYVEIVGVLNGVRATMMSASRSLVLRGPRGLSAHGMRVLRGKGPLTLVEIGAGDLEASKHWARRGAKVIAVDPQMPPSHAIRELQALGGNFVRGTSQDIPSHSASHVMVNFPFPMSGAGRHALNFTWEAIPETLRIVKPGGVVSFVTEDFETAEWLTGYTRASWRGRVETVQIKTTAGEAAPAATGAGVPKMSPDKEVYLVNLYVSE
jgi:hypothetical protein